MMLMAMSNLLAWLVLTLSTFPFLSASLPSTPSYKHIPYVDSCWPLDTTKHPPAFRFDCLGLIKELRERPDAKKLYNFGLFRTQAPWIPIPLAFIQGNCKLVVTMDDGDWPFAKSDEATWVNVADTAQTVVNKCMGSSRIHQLGALSTGHLDRLIITMDGVNIPQSGTGAMFNVTGDVTAA